VKTLSVLISAFKAQQWVAGCLDAVFAQEMPEGWQLQVLLGIDGCDETLNAVRTLRHNALEVVHSPRNQGTYVTFNTLMLYAKGDLICRFDADDVMRPGYLKAQIEAIEAGADMTLTWSIFTDADLKPRPVYSKKNGLEDANGLCRTAWEGQFVIRREVWRHLGGFRAWRTTADTDFLYRVRAAGFRQVAVEDFLYFRRVHGDSLTSHPESNFQSPLRLEVERLVTEYCEQYQRGERSVAVEPVCAAAHTRLQG
jgi:glycosyltransferase involved in cell wall biosynthesis